MRFFAFDGPARAVDPPLTLRHFHEMHQDQYPYPALNLRACLRLCDAGRLYQAGMGVGMQVVEGTFAHLQTLAALELEVRYGTYEFVVEGLPGVRDVLGPGVVLLEVVIDGATMQGSAFLVAPNVLMTARHCVEHATEVRVHPSAADAQEPASLHLP